MLAPCYLIHGGEPLQTEEIISSIYVLAKKEGYNDHVSFEINAQFNWEDLLQKYQNLDLFADRTLIELRLYSDSLSKEGNSTLEQVLQNQDKDVCFIIRAAKLKPQTSNSAWYKLIQKKGQIKIAKPIPTNKWLAWIKQRLQQANFQASQDACEYIAKLYEGNLSAAAQCISKLQATLPPGNLNLEQIQPFVHQGSQFSIFDLTDAAIKGDCERTFRIFHCLKDEGLNPVLMLWGLTREIRNLIRISDDLKMGANLSQAAQKLGIWAERIPEIKKALDRCPAQKLTKILHQAKNIDLIAKGLKQGSVWEPLLAAYLMLTSSKTLIMEELTI